MLVGRTVACSPAITKTNYDAYSRNVLFVFLKVFVPVLMRPLSKFGFSIFPRDATDFFVNATNQALENREHEKKASYTYLKSIIFGNILFRVPYVMFIPEQLRSKMHPCNKKKQMPHAHKYTAMLTRF